MTDNGGLFAPGRWHSQGRRVVYSSASLALATLELIVNLHDKRQLERYVTTRIEIPDELIEDLDQAALSAFLNDPDGFDSRGYGDNWLAGQRSCVLRVPSRVVRQERNYLINPLHPAFEQITTFTDTYQADARLWNSKG